MLEIFQLSQRIPTSEYVCHSLVLRRTRFVTARSGVRLVAGSSGRCRSLVVVRHPIFALSKTVPSSPPPIFRGADEDHHSYVGKNGTNTFSFRDICAHERYPFAAKGPSSDCLRQGIPGHAASRAAFRGVRAASRTEMPTSPFALCATGRCSHHWWDYTSASSPLKALSAAAMVMLRFRGCGRSNPLPDHMRRTRQ